MVPRAGHGRPGDRWWPPPSKPIPVEGGLQARSRRGRIGDTWWSQRFIAVLEAFGIGGRLQRGKRYARTGQVISMEMAAGQVMASVQGSRTKPYRVSIETECSPAPSGMPSRPSWRRARSSWPGSWPTRCPRRSRRRSPSRRPRSSRVGDELDSACSCPDWENPCKHIAAVYYLLAEAFDDDPFLIFAWRGGEGRAAHRSAGPPPEVGPG